MIVTTITANEVIIKSQDYDILIENPNVEVRIENNNKLYIISGEEKKIERMKEQKEKRDINDILKEINNNLLEVIFTLRESQ
jgi:NACalpha-BTF3-like transcription factor